MDSRNDDGKYSRNPSETVKNKYCHYWNNGTCRYSDKDCRYLHKEAPVIVQEVSACFTIQDRMSQRNFFNKDPSGSILGMEQFQVIKEGNR